MKGMDDHMLFYKLILFYFIIFFLLDKSLLI